ncbi:hypothetical protein PC120_g24616 [Phytophthora cactorum]|nr:hypothetical protein PC120_g24616 [Phytophthora cactorum]
MLADTLGKAFISRKRLDSLIGVLWHVISFTPITKPFIQCLTLVQNQCREHNKPGVPMTSFLRKEMTWWNELVFQNEFVGLPMELFEKDTGFDESWLIVTDSNMTTLESMRLRERLVLHQDSPVQDGKGIAAALNKVTREWGPRLTIQGTWCRIIIHGKRWTTELVDKMTCKSASEQHDLLWCTLSQAEYRLYYSTHTFGRRMEQTPKYIADPARGGKTGIAQAGINQNRNTWEIQQELQVLGIVL